MGSGADSAAPQSLAGLRILDFSRILAGPLVTMILGDLGADVTKVERPGGGDETRSWGPPWAAGGEATYFLGVNRNKRAISLDLADREGARQAFDLAARADVLVENFRPGVMDRLGLGYEQLRATNPGLVYCSINAFGRGVGAGLPGYDLLVQAVGGLMSITGDPDGEPQKVGVALVDVIAGLYATVGILAAVRHRDRTGLGQRVEVELLTALLAGLSNQAAAFTCAGVIPTRMGNAHPSIAPYELLETGDGQIAIAVGNDRQFRSLCDALDVPDLADDQRFSSNQQRVAHRRELRDRLAARLEYESTAALEHRLLQAGVPAGAVNDIAAAFALAQSLGLAPIMQFGADEAGAGALRLPRSPIGLSETPVTYRLPPPRHDA